MASLHWKHPTVWRVLSIAGVTTVMALPDVASSSTRSSDQPNISAFGTFSAATDGPALERQSRTFHRNGPSEEFHANLFLSRILGLSKATKMEAVPLSTARSSGTTEFPKEYDFVLVGHGIAGKSALETLQKLCPQASIAVLDPMLSSPLNKNKNKNKNKVDYYSSRCEGFHPLTRQVQISSHDTTTTTSLRYHHAILVATGSRGAPPPHYLLDEKALGRVLELRPTLVPLSTATPNRPVWDPARIRRTLLQAARRGDKVAIVGSGWDAVELALAISAVSKKKQAASLVFGGRGPLSHVLPPYLSAALAKRLASQQHTIPILDRSLIRYIGTDHSSNASHPKNKKPKQDDGHETMEATGLELYTAKSYDFLDASRTAIQWLVVAPEVSGQMGTAALPTANTPSHLQTAQNGRSWYQTWSHLTTTTAPTTREVVGDANNHGAAVATANLLACYADDGRIAVNAELAAGHGVYAAGSVAKFPNPWTGNADVAGVGMEDGTEAGMVAACNMARDYHQHPRVVGGTRLLLGGSHRNDMDLAHHLKHPIPVWRSDTSGHRAATTAADTHHPNALQEAGIYALCVGSCDSERFSTQGFWWTNQSKRLKQWLGDDESPSAGPRRRRTGRLGANPASSHRPVYGRGVVYYMDLDAGQIQGVMMWGFPFTDNAADNNKNKHNQQLNPKLVQRMQEVIQTNGGFRNLGQDSELDRVKFVQYLTQTSRELVVQAIEPFTAIAQTIHPEDLPRPLIRYTEGRPVGMRRVRVLNRKHDALGHGFLGEDLFARSTAITEEPPAPLPSFDNLRELNDTDWEFSLSQRDTARDERSAQRRARAKALEDWAVWEWYQRRWEENEDRARPPKEELLWLRKGDENRGVSAKERFNESMMRAIFPKGR